MKKLELFLLLFIILNIISLGIGYLITKDDLWFKTTDTGLYIAIIVEAAILVISRIFSDRISKSIED